MKKIYSRILLFIGITLLVLFLSTVLIIGPYFKRTALIYESIKQNSTSYYYYYSNIDSTDIRDGIYIIRLADSDSLKNYYQTLNDNFEPTIRFRGSIVPMSLQLYIIEYFGNDSLIAQVIDSNNHKVYVYTPLLHKEKP